MDKLSEGAAELGLKLSPKQIEQFDRYYQLMMQWNERMNLTTITDYEVVQTKHFLDSLTVTLAIGARTPDTETDFNVIDVGTGAGVPGVPLKIFFYRVKLTLLDSTAKKSGFLKHVVTELGLDDVEVIAGRAEDVAHQPEYREKFALVLSRAVAKLPTLAELTLPLSQVGGMVVAYKKGDFRQEISDAAKAIDTLGGKLREVKEIELEALPGERCLVIIDKVHPTPDIYPRRPGIPAKRPIS